MSEEKPVYQVQLRQRGQVTIPRAIRERLALDEGDVLSMAQIDDFVFFVPRPLRVPELSEKFATLMDEAGLSLADLLAGLAEERQRSRQPGEQ